MYGRILNRQINFNQMVKITGELFLTGVNGNFSKIPAVPVKKKDLSCVQQE